MRQCYFERNAKISYFNSPSRKFTAEELYGLKHLRFLFHFILRGFRKCPTNEAERWKFTHQPRILVLDDLISKRTAKLEQISFLEGDRKRGKPLVEPKFGKYRMERNRKAWFAQVRIYKPSSVLDLNGFESNLLLKEYYSSFAKKRTTWPRFGFEVLLIQKLNLLNHIMLQKKTNEKESLLSCV